MGAFYQRLAAGEDPVTALAAVKRQYRAATGVSAPWVWARFQLMGR